MNGPTGRISRVPSSPRTPAPALGAIRPGRLTDWLYASRAARDETVNALVERIRKEDASLQAWRQVEAQPVTGDGPLAGIPFGVKEIIETNGLATEYGSSIYRARVATTDAAIVRELRARGGRVIGTTRSTAFAYFTPTTTRNPRNLAHTPGGSSSGSAAAVAAGMVPFALGTQTAGSVLRPASFCGVVGFKPSFGLRSMEGIFPFAPSLDTLGFFTATAGDMAALWPALGHHVPAAEVFPFAVVEPVTGLDPAMEVALAAAVERLRGAGLTVETIDLRAMQANLEAAVRTVMRYEGARVHEAHVRQFADQMGALADLVRVGLELPIAAYDAARTTIGEWKGKLAAIFRATPVILSPAATGPAPAGLGSTGDPRMNAPWTALGMPAISIPLPVRDGLPLGLQLTADHGQEGRLLRAAVRVEEILNGN